MGLTRPRAHQIFDIDYKQAVRVITTSNITLSGGAPTVIDGVTLALNDRVLVAGQNTASQNGLYYVTTLGTGSNGTWQRSIDGNETGEIQAGMIVMVTEGTLYADSQWKLTTNDPITVGVSALTFEQSSAYAFGTIAVSGQTSVVADAVGDTLTLTAGNNIEITTNAGSDAITFAVQESPTFSQTVTFSGNITGNLIPSANVTYNLGSPTQRWKEIFLAGNTIDIGGATISADLVTGSLILTGPDGAEFILSGNDADDALGAFGFVTAGNTEPSISTTTGALTVAGGAGIAGNLHVGDVFKANGNVEGGNLVTAGQVSAVGNIVGNYILGNITFASGYNTTKLFNGTSEANIGTTDGNANISIGGTSNVAVFASTGEYVTGVISATGNITGGNLVTAGVATVTGNITGGNITTTGLGTIGTLSVTGNALISGNLTVDGNVTYINITDLNVEDPIIGLGRGPNNTPLSTDDGKDRGEQLWYYTTSEQSGFIGYDNSAGKLIAASNVSIANEIVTVNSYGTFVVGTLEGTTASLSGNVTGGNLVTAGIATVTGNITGGNIVTAGVITSTGNITGGNLVTSGQILATGNISGSTLIAAGNIVVQSRQQVKFYDTDSSNFISLRAPNALTGDYLLTLPTGYGNADQVLSTNGAGGLTWVDQAGGGGSSATSYPNSTVSPVPGSTGNFDLSYNFVQTSQEVPFESSATDAFGVNLGEVYSMMDPGGEVLEPVDLGALT